MMVPARSLLLLLLCATTSAAAPTNAGATFSAVLGYPPISRALETSPVFRNHGTTYRFRLDPQRDVEGNLVVFELVLEPTSRSSRAPNILDPTGKLHGYQKWFFAARDFAKGPENSAYGSTRSIDLPNLGLVVHVEVLRCAVKPTAATPNDPARYRFTGMTLRIATLTEPIEAR